MYSQHELPSKVDVFVFSGVLDPDAINLHYHGRPRWTRLLGTVLFCSDIQKLQDMLPAFKMLVLQNPHTSG